MQGWDLPNMNMWINQSAAIPYKYHEAGTATAHTELP